MRKPPATTSTIATTTPTTLRSRRRRSRRCRSFRAAAARSARRRCFSLLLSLVLTCVRLLSAGRRGLEVELGPGPLREEQVVEGDPRALLPDDVRRQEEQTHVARE